MSRKNQTQLTARLVINHTGEMEGRMTHHPFQKVRDQLLQMSPAYQEGQRKRVRLARELKVKGL